MVQTTDRFFDKLLDLKALQLAVENSLVTLVLTCAVIFVLFCWWYKNNKRRYKLPPGPYGVPVLGYLPFLGAEAYKDFDKLSKKYGNVLSLYMGQTYTVILGDFEAVKEAYSKSTTTDRPERLFDFLPDGVGFSGVNGDEWIEQRKYSVKAMRDFGMGRSKWENLVQEEVENFVKLIHSFKGKPINVCRLLTLSVSNNISSFVLGRRQPLTDENVDFVCGALDSVFMFFSQTGWRHYFPFLCDVLAMLPSSRYTSIRKEFMDFNNFIRNEVETRKKSALADGNAEIYIDDYLLEIEKNKKQNLRNTFNERNLRGNVQALFLGGSDTTRNSINWLLIFMANFLDIQNKVHAELDAVLGKERSILWTERTSVPYTFAVIMEGQRWRTIAPLNTARIAMEDIKVCGYDIPKGTTIISNNWGMHNDVKYWMDPEKFQPERFLLENGQVNFKPDSFVPFSYGKRMCPGETVAMVEILCYFVTLMQNFEVLPPENSVPNLDGTLGLTYQALPQDLRFVSRL